MNTEEGRALGGSTAAVFCFIRPDSFYSCYSWCVLFVVLVAYHLARLRALQIRDRNHGIAFLEAARDDRMPGSVLAAQRRQPSSHRRGLEERVSWRASSRSRPQIPPTASIASMPRESWCGMPAG